MADLTFTQQEFLVQHLAYCVKNRDVVKAFNTHFRKHASKDERTQADITAEQVSGYNAATLTGKMNMGVDLQALFWKYRAEYTAGAAEVPIATQRYRLEMLQDLVENDPVVQRSAKLKASLAEQAAKEMGGAFNQKAAGASMAEVVAISRGMLRDVKKAVKATVQDVQLQEAVLEAIDAELEEDDEEGGA